MYGREELEVIELIDGNGFGFSKEQADKVINAMEDRIKELELYDYRRMPSMDTESFKDIRGGVAYEFEKLKARINGLEAENERLLKIVRHQKYKRCLAMAKWCDQVMMSCELRGYAVHRIWANKHELTMRWKYRWLDIAEKFKE